MACTRSQASPEGTPPNPPFVKLTDRHFSEERYRLQDIGLRLDDLGGSSARPPDPRKPGVRSQPRLPSSTRASARARPAGGLPVKSDGRSASLRGGKDLRQAGSSSPL